MRKPRQLIDVRDEDDAADSSRRLSVEELRQLVPALKERGKTRLLRDLHKEDDEA